MGSLGERLIRVGALDFFFIEEQSVQETLDTLPTVVCHHRRADPLVLNPHRPEIRPVSVLTNITAAETQRPTTNHEAMAGSSSGSDGITSRC